MAYLRNLDVVARRTGYPVKLVSGWKDRGHGSFGSVLTVVCHHTAGPSTGNMPSLGVITHGRSGLPGPLANLGLARNGTIYVVAAGVAWHAGVVRSSSYSNSHAIGIEAEEDGVSGWAKVQLDAYAALCRELCEQYDLGVGRVLGHKEVCSPPGRKIDPNFNMDRFRARVRDSSSGGDWFDMATKEDLAAVIKAEAGKAVLRCDDVPAYPDSETNPTWQLRSTVSLLVKQNVAIAKAIEALATELPVQTRQAVQAALAEAVVQVDVNVTGGDQS